MKVELTDEMVREVVQQALMETISPENRDRLIQAAIKELLTPAGAARVSPLQAAFSDAVGRYAREAVFQRMTEDGAWKAEVDRLLLDTLRAFTTDEKRRAQVVEKLADALATTLLGRGY